MKKLACIAAVVLVAACSEPAPDTDTDTAAVEEAAAPAEAEVMAADGQPTPGKYKITTSDGKIFMEDVKADGTYVQTDPEGKVVETGKWEQKSAEQYCYTVDEQYREEGDTGAQVCNTEGIGDDGKWFSTNPDGKTATVERAPA